MSPILELGIFFSRVLVGLTLVLAGALKLKAGSRWFLKTLLAYDLVHGKTAALLSKGLPWVEVACGVLLVLGFFTPLVAIAGSSILLIFTSAVTSAILRDKPVDCGCFGRSTKVSRVRWTLVYRNIVLMGLLMPVYASGGGSLSVDAWLKVWLNNAGQHGLIQAWLVVVWVMSLAIALALQVLTRKRAAGPRNKEMAEQISSEV